MRYLITLLMLTTLIPARADAIEVKVQRALVQLKRNHYDFAAELRLELPTLDPEDLSSAELLLGMTYLKNAKLHERLFNVSLTANLDYLARISAKKDKDSSRMVKLFLAESYLAAGKPARAAFQYQKILKDPAMGQSPKDLAKVGLGTALYLQGNREQADRLWSGLANSTDPQTLSELAFAYRQTGLKARGPEKLCDRALVIATKLKKPASIRVVSNSVGVFVGAGQVKKALNLLKEADLKTFSFQEELGKNKTLRFYNITLLKNLASLYRKASIEYLELASRRPKPNRMVNYYLSEAYALDGNIPASDKAIDAFLSSWPLPKLQKNAATATHAKNSIVSGRDKEGRAALEVLAQDNWNDHNALIQTLGVCSDLKIQCTQISSAAKKLIETKEGRSLSSLNFALGRYYLGRGDTEAAVAYLEASRDKSYKNKIEYNDPLLLVDLAEVYFKTRKFSEALEIFFEMSRQYPAVRQIQNAMQGIYSMVQESAGDVKVL